MITNCCSLVQLDDNKKYHSVDTFFIEETTPQNNYKEYLFRSQLSFQ